MRTAIMHSSPHSLETCGVSAFSHELHPEIACMRGSSYIGKIYCEHAMECRINNPREIAPMTSLQHATIVRGCKTTHPAHQTQKGNPRRPKDSTLEVAARSGKVRVLSTPSRAW